MSSWNFKKNNNKLDGIFNGALTPLMCFGDDENENEVIVGELQGHTLILGLYSPVFRQQFYGHVKETEDIIPVRNNTVKAFNLMFDIFSVRRLFLVVLVC